MIPLWKVAREYDRFVQQMKAVVGLAWEPFVQRQYDANRAAKLRITQGAQAQHQKYAIYLIYQPNEILASTLQTCQHFEDQGYSVLAVSNAALSDAARLQLQGHVWKLIERPNYGYDFGGYPDGVLTLLELGITPERLVILNDSTWMPLQPSDTLIARMEDPSLDCAGSIVHHNKKSGWLIRRPSAVIESYLFSFSKTAFAHPAFQKYWRGYRMSSNKYNAVHRGERRVAAVMMTAGLRTNGLFSREELVARLGTQEPEILQKTLIYAAYTEDDFAAQAAQLLGQYDATPTWRDKAVAHIDTVVRKRNFHGAFVYASLTLFDLTLLKKGTGTFLKKSYGTLYTRMRERYVTAVAAGDLPRPAACVLAEIITRDGLTAPDQLVSYLASEGYDATGKRHAKSLA